MGEDQVWSLVNAPARGRVAAGGVLGVSWASFSRFELSAGAARWDLAGGAGDERFVVLGVVGAVDLGAGDDRLATTTTPVAGARLAGGDGRDLVDIGYCDDAIALLARDLYRCTDRDGTETEARLPGVEGVAVVARNAVVIGSRRGSDLLVAESCTGEVRGQGGDDRLRARALGETFPGACRPFRITQHGGAGDDVLHGRWGRDLLYGGPGRDTAYGFVGRDTCRAEVERSCED